ncbi:MAG: right-handed parallel beta-helix repeat-containing protein [Chloroflexota bacterium]|nr:right-handed parallel beta-helix repeat-containing protein [Chloroflexota bacterium]MDE2962241.1 right-handed parallel beta-helix repeat-containing protein [Chloroflexota bacterium]
MIDVRVTPDRYTRGTFVPSQYPGLETQSAPGAVIEIRTDGVMLDLSGVVLDGERKGGVGIWVHDCEDVTIANGTVISFHYGIHADNVSNLNIRGCVVSDNTNPLDAGWLPDISGPVEEGFGGGIYLRRVRHSAIENNQTGNNFNGISLIRSDHNVISGNHASYCGNVGIYLLRSSHNEISDNQAEHCIRYTDRFWCDTADSAGILLEDGSNHNRITGNSLRYSGDGFFIRGHHGEPSRDNFVARNDASHSPNNAFEAVFTSGNVFEGNIANYSNYGFWLGYSTDSAVRGNEIRTNRFDGIAIEHGQGNVIEGNRIEENRNGIRLWSDPAPQTPGTAGNPRRHCTVSGNRVADSRECGILVTDDHDLTLERNSYERNARDYRF